VVVPDVLYTDLRADVATLVRDLVMAQLSTGGLMTAMEICIPVMRIMTLQPGRRWLDPLMVLRLSLLAQEDLEDNPGLLFTVRELLASQLRWDISGQRHGGTYDTGDSHDWDLVRELGSLPLEFDPELRALLARSIIRQDVLGAGRTLTAYSKRHPKAANGARRLLDRHAPTLAAIWSAEFAPTRPMAIVSEQDLETRGKGWRALGLLAVGVMVGLLTVAI